MQGVVCVPVQGVCAERVAMVKVKVVCWKGVASAPWCVLCLVCVVCGALQWQWRRPPLGARTGGPPEREFVKPLSPFGLAWLARLGWSGPRRQWARCDAASACIDTRVACLDCRVLPRPSPNSQAALHVYSLPRTCSEESESFLGLSYVRMGALASMA